ncbi:MAG: hypothetical protein FWD77_11220, partial [Betaproteobacteria bacterium]|nr:hypothetical protein [Betaproteobacteria bacterium]
GLFCNVRVHLDGSGQWSLLAADVCPPSASANDSYNLATGMLSLPHINIPGLGEFINVSARLDANTWRWQLLGADPAGGGGGGGGIAACFSADRTITYAITGNGSNAVSRTIGPTIYNGQAAIKSTDYTSNGSVVSSEYSAITSSDVVYLAGDFGGGVLLSYTPQMVLAHLSMQPGSSFDQRNVMAGSAQVDTHTVFVGYETLTLAGKTFSNVCHFRNTRAMSGAGITTADDAWHAPGYGVIKDSATNSAAPGFTAYYEYAGER